MASKSLGTLTIDLIAKTGGFEQGMSRAERAADRSAKRIQQNFAELERRTDRWARNIAMGATAAGTALATWTLSMSKSMDATLKMAQQIGTTTEALTGLRYAAQQFSNVSDQTFDMSLRRMTRRIAEAADGSGAAKNAIEALGLSAQSLAGLSVDEQFLRVADAMKGTADQGSRLRATMAIFDTEGMPLVNALSQGREELQKYTEEARRLGVVIDTDAAVAASEFRTNLDRLTAVARGASITIANELMPDLADFSGTLLRFAGLTKDAWEEVDSLSGKTKELAGYTGLHEWLNSLGRQIATTMDEFSGLKLTLDGMMKSWRLTMSSFGVGNYDEALAAVTQHQQDRRNFNFRANRERWMLAENVLQVRSDPVVLVDLTDPDNDRDKPRGEGKTTELQAWKEADKAIRQAAESSRYIAAINRELDVFQQQQNLTIAGIGMGDRQREQMERELAVRQDYAERRRQLEEAQQVESTRLSEDQYQRRIQALQDAEQRQIQILRDAAVLKAQAEGDWTNGAIRGLQNYADEVENVAESVARVVGNSFRGMEDSLVSFVRTGKADFRSLADSMISDMMRIAIQQSITGPLAGMIGGLFASTAAPAGVTPGLDWTFASGGYTGDGGKYEPAGIVHRGEGVLNQEEISRLGGESGFNALRRALRTGHAVGGMAGRPALSPMGLTPASPNVAFNIINQGEPMQATQRGAPRWNGEQWVIDVVMERVRNSQGIRNQLRDALSN